MLTSRSNPTIKAIRALRQRKEREATQRFLIEGIRIVAEAIECRAPLESLVVAPELLTSSYALDLVQYQREHGTSIIETSADVFASLSNKDHPQGLAAVGQQL
nr:RNA methyltransferase [Herpetosiphon sp.]